LLCKGQTCGCANLDKASSLIFVIAWKKSKTNKKIREIFLALENLSLYDYAGLKPTIFCHITYQNETDSPFVGASLFCYDAIAMLLIIEFVDNQT
jgi:hypothetical protein